MFVIDAGKAEPTAISVGDNATNDELTSKNVLSGLLDKTELLAVKKCSIAHTNCRSRVWRDFSAEDVSSATIFHVRYPTE